MNTMRSLGTLGMVAAFCAAQTADAGVFSASSVADVPIQDGTTVGLDINDDGTSDFQLLTYFANASFITLTGLTGTQALAELEPGVPLFSQVLQVGDTVGPSLTFGTMGELYDGGYPLQSPASQGSFYVGVRFADLANDYHYGWLQFSFPAGDGYPLNQSLVVSAAWVSAVDVPLIIVPEPASTVVWGAALAFVVPLYRRRRSGEAHLELRASSSS